MSLAQRKNCLLTRHTRVREKVLHEFDTVLAIRLLAGEEPAAAYQQTIESVEPLYRQPPFVAELPHFRRVLGGRIGDEPEDAILGDGYVVHTLEASLWCLLQADSYRDATLAAVNLGQDTDMTAAVVGGLAGILWGADGIPADWISALARSEDIRSLAGRRGYEAEPSLPLRGGGTFAVIFRPPPSASQLPSPPILQYNSPS